MGITDELGRSAQDIDASPMSQTPAQVLCAYNQTRECFLAFDVLATDRSFVNIGEILSARALRSEEGIWLKPFSEISAQGLYAPLDLIYLDSSCCVIEAVESFPTFQAECSVLQPASVLALPAHSIYSSQTQPGDQLILCVPEEMEIKLERLAAGNDDEGILQGAVVLRDQPLWSGGPGLVELETGTVNVDGKQSEAHEMTLIEPGVKAVRPPQSWLQRWWSPDPRRAPRERAPGLAAYYWNGAVSSAHVVKDISATGLYVLTEERWYPGSLILMTLRNTQAGPEVAERTISIFSRAVRWGNDGVGLQFVLPDEVDAAKGAQLDGANKAELSRFLQQFLYKKS